MLVGVALRNFKNKSGFHECPRCKSHSVWKADPHGTLEETLHFLLKLCPYRCARCDKRFMDSKVIPANAPLPRMTRWLTYARSKAGNVFKSNERSPFEEGLKLNFALPPSQATSRVEKRESPLTENMEHLTKV